MARSEKKKKKDKKVKQESEKSDENKVEKHRYSSAENLKASKTFCFRNRNDRETQSTQLEADVTRKLLRKGNQDQHDQNQDQEQG